jgi:hypothetical protein
MQGKMISEEELEKLKVLSNDARSYGEGLRLKLIQIATKNGHDMMS